MCSQNSSTSANKYKKAYYCTKSSKDKICSFTAHEANQMFIDVDLTREQYDIIRRTNMNFFPWYKFFQKEKKCYALPKRIP